MRTDPNRAAAARRAAYDRVRLAESEISRQWVKDGNVPDEWWERLLQLVNEYHTAIERCKRQL